MEIFGHEVIAILLIHDYCGIKMLKGRWGLLVSGDEKSPASH
jgi:hypothetical protein